MAMAIQMFGRVIFVKNKQIIPKLNMGNTIIPKLFSDYRKLLWTNPSPTSVFNAQDVMLDLTEYDAVDIEFWYWSNDDTLSTTRTPKGETGAISIVSNSNGHTSVRDWEVFGNRVYFGTGKDLYGTTFTNPSNSACIPYKIYGINYKKVAPGVIDAEIEPLAAGATLYRIGRMRMLVLSDFVYGTAMSSLASGDRPSSTATGMGLRYSNSAYFCFAFIAVNTNGTVSISNVGTYNTSAGVSTPGSGEKFNATVVWYVFD